MPLVLVTGASGMIGQRLLAVLKAKGWTSRALAHVRPVAGADEVCWGDLGDADSLRRACAGVAGVVHLAALTHSRNPRSYFDVNTVGTRALLAALPGGLSRFVFVSTRAISQIGGSYSLSKLRAEDAVREADAPWVIVRLPEVFGGGGAEGVDDILARARRGATIPLVGDGDDSLCPIYIDDAVSAIAAALSSSSAVGRTYTLAGDCLPARQLALRCIRALGSSSRIVSVPLPAVRTLARAARFLPLPLYPDQLARLKAPKPPRTAEAEADLGFRPRSLEQVLTEGLQ
jgi:nucleoside-diphosphate-sugar epimerase